MASTNFLDRLDPGLSKRPSRFDRKYLFPLPNQHERTLYCEYWRHKLESKSFIDFPQKLCPAMAHITPGFSFAFLQECFVATLLILARRETGLIEDGDDDDLDKYELWKTFKQQADILRKEVEGQKSGRHSQLMEWCRSGALVDQETHAPTSEATSMSCEHCAHSHSAHDQDSVGRFRKGLPDLQSLRVQDEVLPELPPQFQKRNYINTAAYDYRLA